MSAPVAVVSHPRSGTHWLCSLVWRWFYAGRRDGLEAVMQHHPNARFVMPDGEQRDGGVVVPWSHLFGGHYYDPRSKRVRELLRDRPVVYLTRNGRDVMYSYWTLVRVRDGYPRPLLEFIRDTNHPGNAGNPLPRPLTPAELWWWSTLGWTRHSGAHVVTYEELLEDADAVRDRLAGLLDIEPADDVDPGTLVGYVPSPEPRVGRGVAAFGPCEEAEWQSARLRAEELLLRPGRPVAAHAMYGVP